ncbi:MAG TPA: hypothetical protein VGM88_21180 [Kofleriaceae bacterium]|jgi:hypothetical protein
MQRWVIGVGLLAASVARADPAVESAVRANVDGVLQGKIEVAHGVWGGFEPLRVGAYTPRITVNATATAAWFAVEVALTGQIAFGYSPMDKTKATWPVRISGVLVDDHGWKVVAEEVSFEVGDKALTAKTFGYLDYPALDKDPDARAIAAWLPGKLLAHRSEAAAPAFVSGTAPGDTARDAAALAKLVGSWDKLKLQTRAVTTKTLAGGKLLWADVVVTLEVRKGEFKELRLGVVAVPEAGEWRWVALNWNPEVDPDVAAH